MTIPLTGTNHLDARAFTYQEGSARLFRHVVAGNGRGIMSKGVFQDRPLPHGSAPTIFVCRPTHTRGLGGRHGRGPTVQCVPAHSRRGAASIHSPQGDGHE